MRTIAASELKRRGLAALHGLLRRGPVHVLQRNRPACVVLSPEDYERLEAAATADAKAPDAWSLLMGPPMAGGRSRADLDAEIATERASWDRPDTEERRKKPAARRRR
jgi:PHD/YefM family antitoxin component YafN of YafNO toxin-antitoxin module